MSILLGLLGALGIGGVGAAAFFIPGFGARLAEIGGAVLKWLLDNPMVLAALAGVLFGLWERHEVTVARREVPAWQSAYGDMKGAYLLERGQVQSLAKAISDQNHAIDTFAATQADREKAAKAALREATGRAQRLEAVAGRIDAERAQEGPGGQNCRTGKAVLDARGDL